MLIRVTARPRSHQSSVEKINDAHFIIRVVEPPTDNKANLAIITALARTLNVSPSVITLAGGAKSKHKVFYIDQRIDLR